MATDRNGLEILDEDRCRRLLCRATVGRIGLVADGSTPLILPVNFHFDGQRIVILTTEGTKLAAATAHEEVAFEIDEFDSMYHSGWSVLVTGRLEVLARADDLDVITAAPLVRWAGRDGATAVALTPESITGRCLNGDHPRWGDRG